jgi:hypothetical protein
MATALLEHVHVFGLKGDVKDNVWYIDETLLLYPAGHNTVLYHTDTNVQRFIHGTDGTEGITALTVSSNKRFCAVAERSEKGIISIFDLHTLKKKKVGQRAGGEAGGRSDDCDSAMGNSRSLTPVSPPRPAPLRIIPPFLRFSPRLKRHRSSMSAWRFRLTARICWR